MTHLALRVLAWPILAVALLMFGFAPGVVLRLIVLAFRRDDPRRRELLAELYAVPRIERPFWVAGQLEMVLFEGLRGRLTGGAAGSIPEQDAAATGAATLLQRAAAGDQLAWEQLVEQYAQLIWAITRDFKLAESDASEVAQTTWLRLLEHIDGLEYPARVGSWLAATARNECLRTIAARRKDLP